MSKVWLKQIGLEIVDPPFSTGVSLLAVLSEEQAPTSKVHNKKMRIFRITIGRCS